MNFRCPVTGMEGLTTGEFHRNLPLKKAAESFKKDVLEQASKIGIGETVDEVRSKSSLDSNVGTECKQQKDQEEKRKAASSSRCAFSPLTLISTALPEQCAPGLSFATSIGWSGQR